MDRKENEYVRRTQKDYPMSFKMLVVKEFEETGIRLRVLSRKYGIQGHEGGVLRPDEKGHRLLHPSLQQHEVSLLLWVHDTGMDAFTKNVALKNIQKETAA